MNAGRTMPHSRGCRKTTTLGDAALKTPVAVFVDNHNGMPGGGPGVKSNRHEEHLAMALWNDFDEQGKVNHAEISTLQLLDYQFPLQS